MRVVDEALLDYLRGLPCAFCGARAPSQVHHIGCRGMGGGSRLDKVLACLPVCWLCHGKYQADRKACFAKVAEREGLESGDVAQEAVWRLLRTPKEKRA